MSHGWLLNKKIVIVGGTEGIGLSASVALIREGANLVVIGRDDEKSLQAKELLGDKIKIITGDATEESLTSIAIDTCESQFGGFDALYHVAGGSGRKFGDGPLHEMTNEGWNRTLELNLSSIVFSNKAALNYFLKKKQPGVILNMSSVLAHAPSPKYFTTHAYAASKAAIAGLCKASAAYYAPYNIRINIIAPGLVKSPMSQRAAADESIMHFIKTKQPLDGGRIGIPEDLNGAAIFLLSDRSSFMTGQVVTVDGGWTVSEGQY